MPDISDLQRDDIAYVLNGHQNNLFSALVTRVDDDGVEVYIEAKNDTQWFYKATGHADAEPLSGEETAPRATLVHPADPRVRILNARKIFKNHHVLVQDAASAFRKDPSADNASALQSAVERWTFFSKVADPFAIRAESIEEYKRLTKQI